MSDWPITFDDVLAARERLRPHLAPTPLRRYAPLDDAVGAGIRVLVKHENFQPTGAFKVRNGVSALTRARPAERARGVVAATRGNHGLGLAWAGRACSVPGRRSACRSATTPRRTRPCARSARDSSRRGATTTSPCSRRSASCASRACTSSHSTNDRAVVAGAGTLTLELLEQEPALDALVVVGRRRLAGGRRADRGARAAPGRARLRRAGRGRLGRARRVAPRPARLEADRGRPSPTGSRRATRTRSRSARCARGSPAS